MDGAHRVHRSESDTTPPSMQVVKAVADHEGTDPVGLVEPLYDTIDPDALDALFDGPSDRHGKITFRYHGYRVTVHSDGRVDVTDRR